MDEMISVIMSTFNESEEELLLSIQSILNQTYANFEFIIVNDNPENTQLKMMLEKFEQQDPRIRLVRNEKNIGLAVSLNKGIDIAQGEYIARMDADDISRPKRLERQYQFLEKHIQYAFAGCNADLIDENGIWGARIMPEKPEKRDFLPFSPFIHPSVMVRREVYLMSGGYYVSKETWRCEDYELFMRLYAQGFCGYNMQERLFCYREDRASYERRKFRYRLDEARIRRRNFKNLGMNGPVAWLYTIRPVAAGLIPIPFLMYIKRRQVKKEVGFIDAFETEKRIQTE